MSPDEQNFWEFLTEYGTGQYIKYIYILPYLMGKDDEWEALITDNKDYYFYKDEIELIEEKKARLAEIIGENKNIVDIGPGSDNAIENKMMNALSGFQTIRSYTSIDIEQSYTVNAVKFVHKKYPTLLTTAITADLINENTIENLAHLKALTNKAIISFSCMIHNLADPLINKLFRHLSSLMNPSDFFILGLDTNQDPVSLLKSYEASTNMSADILRYFKFRLQVADFDPEAFKIVNEFHEDPEMFLSYIKFNAVATKSQSFEWKGRTFEIKEGDKYFLWRSWRFKTEFIRNASAEHGFELLEVIQNAKNRVKLFVLKKL
jgi:uncharacterized SAM-dependent methyltransferase